MPIYLVTEHTRDESYSWLSDQSQNYKDDGDYWVESKLATYDNVTLDMIITACERELEGANYHSLINLPNWLSIQLHKYMTEEQVKRFFWDVCKEKGFLWTI